MKINECDSSGSTTANFGNHAGGFIPTLAPSGVCPNCGFCPHCGRKQQTAPATPYHPYSNPWYPTYAPPYYGGYSVRPLTTSLTN